MKRGSIFVKLIFVFLLTMILTALLLGLLGSTLYKGYFIKDRQDVMLEQGRIISSLVASRMGSEKDLQAILKLATSPRTETILYDRELRQISKSAIVGGREAEDRIELGEQRDVLEAALRGEEQVVPVDDQRGDLLLIAIPVKRGGETQGVVLMQGLGLQRHFGVFNQQLIDAGIVAVIVSSAVAFLLSRSIARPLQEMSAIVRWMAKGDFSRKVKVRSRDEIGELAEAFNHMADELSELETMRREFVAHASHELRSPLTSIRGFVGAMLDGTIPVESQRPFLERINRESERLGKLVDQLLDLSALEDQQASGDAGVADMESVVREAVATLQPLLDKKALHLSCDSEAVRVRGQAERLEQVVINLLSNAIRFSEDGGDIHISVRKEAEGGRVEVSDHGIGIPAEEQERVWERFYKVDQARTTERGGTGLGLPIAKRIIENAGGRIGLQSAAGRGTTAWFVLPLADEE